MAPVLHSCQETTTGCCCWCFCCCYFNKQTIKHKKLDDLSESEVKEAFGTDNIKVYTSSEKLIVDLKSKNWVNANLLMMSSGNFDGIDFKEFGENIIH